MLALQAYLGNSNIHHPARHYPRRVLAYTLMKKFLLLAFITVACEARAQDGQCVRQRAAMVETIRAYARSEADVLGPQGNRSASCRQWNKRDAIGSPPGGLVRSHTWTRRFSLATTKQCRSRL
jgi:hypothetical protein